jgi:murein DD-endopeptidase MepM/ murein hydrolase activator NlpD
MTVEDIISLNKLTDDKLDVGQKLKIRAEETKPAPKKKTSEIAPEPAAIPQDMQIEEIVYVVVRNDNLSKIAKQYSTSVNEIKDLNDLKSNRLKVGQKLKIQTLVPKPKKKIEPVTKPVTVTDNKKARQTVPATKDTTGTSRPGSGQVRKLTVDELPDEYVYEVKAKDNLYRIALNHKIDLKDMLKLNDFESDNTVISIGQKIIIKDPSDLNPSPEPEKKPDNKTGGDTDQELRPAKSDSVVIEKYYIVQRKDNLYRIAKEYGITVEELKRLNNLKSNSIVPGQKLYIVVPEGTVVPDDVTSGVTEDDLKTKSVIRTDLIMPVDGKILSEYGIRNGRPHKGIDLGAPAGTPVFAVLDGTVVYSGLQGNYGNVVVVEHPEYVMTVYAHNEKNIVSVGDIVKQGQIIATVGSTGNATAPHVHFEYRIKGKAINPRKVLPLGK